VATSCASPSLVHLVGRGNDGGRGRIIIVLVFRGLVEWLSQGHALLLSRNVDLRLGYQDAIQNVARLSRRPIRRERVARGWGAGLGGRRQVLTVIAAAVCTVCVV